MKEFIDKLIERLEQQETHFTNEYYKGFGDEDRAKYIAYGDAIEIVNQLAEKYKGGWIPCSERLPDVFDNVLICTKEGGRAIGHRCPNQENGRYYDLHSSPIDDVIAWQHLPQPYKEGE